MKNDKCEITGFSTSHWSGKNYGHLAAGFAGRSLQIFEAVLLFSDTNGVVVDDAVVAITRHFL